MSDYLSRTGSIIVILATMAAAMILATQFSFGRLAKLIFSLIRGGASLALAQYRAARDERRKAKQRREILVKYGKKDVPVEAPKPVGQEAGARAGASAPRSRRPQRTPPVVQKKAPAKAPITPPLPLPEPERIQPERRLGSYTLPPLSLLDAPKGRTEDRRARADGFGTASRREVPRILGRRLGRPDSSRSGRHDVRVQARRRRQVLQGDRPRRRPVSRDAGRVGADRSHSWQGDGRHSDSQSESRRHLAARAARVGHLRARRCRS